MLAGEDALFVGEPEHAGAPVVVEIAVSGDAGAEFCYLAVDDGDARVPCGADVAVRELFDVIKVVGERVDVEDGADEDGFGASDGGVVADHGEEVVCDGVVFGDAFAEFHFGADAVKAEVGERAFWKGADADGAEAGEIVEGGEDLAGSAVAVFPGFFGCVVENF